jgi:hypothetical protein
MICDITKHSVKEEQTMKATFPDGTMFDGTPEEFLVIRNQMPGAVNGHKNAAKDVHGTGVWTEKRARRLWESLDPRHDGGDQKKLLRFLIENGGRAKEGDLRKHLGIKKGQELAGVLANLSRNARREAKDDDVKAVVRVYEHGIRVYYIPDDLLQFLRQF